MTEPLTDQDQHVLAALATAVHADVERMQAAEARLKAALEQTRDANKAVQRSLDRLRRNRRRPLWPFYLTGGLGGATAALLVDLLLS